MVLFDVQKQIIVKNTTKNVLSTPCTFSVFPVIWHLLYLGPRGKKKHVIALYNSCKASACVNARYMHIRHAISI